MDSFFCFKRRHKEFIRKNKLILKTQQRIESEKHNVFTEEINKIALSSNDDKKIQSIDSIEAHAYGRSKAKKQQCNNNIIQQQYCDIIIKRNKKD